jgi:hypothetical protein
LLVDGVRIAGMPNRLHWDGGVLDYHLDLDFGDGDGLVLYPHFYSCSARLVRQVAAMASRACAQFDRALLIAPSDAFVASLPGGKIPDRRDFFAFTAAERERRWQAVLDASARTGGGTARTGDNGAHRRSPATMVATFPADVPILGAMEAGRRLS